MMLTTILIILGVIIVLPILLTLVGLIIATLIGGYLSWVVSLIWEILLAAGVIYLVYKIVTHFLNKRG